MYDPFFYILFIWICNNEANCQRILKFYSWQIYADGKFGAMMEVYIQNSGPVTLEIESPTKSTCNDNTGNVENKKVLN